MISGSLIDILNEKKLSQSTSPTHLHPHSESKVKKYPCSDYLGQRTSSPQKKTNKVIKITQFNSSLLIGDEKVMQNFQAPLVHSLNSNTPNQKNFSIKKVNEFKNKVMLGAQKTVQIQLKKKQQQLKLPLKPSSPQKSPRKSFSQKKSIDKILVATKCSIKNQVPSFNQLIDYGDSDTFCRKNSTRKIKELNDLLHLQRLQCSSTFKDLLAQTNESLKQESKHKQKVEQPSVFENCFTEDLESSLSIRVGSPSPRKLISRHILEQKKYQENLEREKKQMLEFKKELNKNYAKPFNPPENISAQAYIIYETDLKKVQYNRKVSPRKEDSELNNQQRKMLINSHKVIASLNPRVPVQMASLTKIMTCILTLQISKRFAVSLTDEEITIGLFEQNIGGTSAHIKKGEIYKVQQLLFGLMLPSGNDASVALAVWGGRKLLDHETKKSSLGSSGGVNEQFIPFVKRECYSRFLEEMNKKADELNMEKTRYANSHGLANIDNKSCPFDIAILSEYAMNNPKFREIVSTKRYECSVRNIQEDSPLKCSQTSPQRSGSITMLKKESMDESEEGKMEEEEMKDAAEGNEEFGDWDEAQDDSQMKDNVKTAIWQNTHLLLQSKPDLYVGIKTGVTMNAGPCLASCIEFSNRRFIIVVLNCKTMKYRFKDTQNLRKWLFSRQDFKYKEKEKKSRQID